jgi:hypothetical protein
MKRVYICSPLRGDYAKNTARAVEYCKQAAAEGILPIALHIYFPLFLDDRTPDGRSAGLTMGLELLDLCDEIWVFGKRISMGMAAEIDAARKLGKRVTRKAALNGR